MDDATGEELPDTVVSAWSRLLGTEPDTLADADSLSRTYKPPGWSMDGGSAARVEGSAEIEASERYELGKTIGRGGMGQVLEARQHSLRRTVAIKTLHRLAGACNPSVREHFRDEAVVTGSLEHPNIVPVYGLGQTSAGEPFLAMKRVVGEPWSERLERGVDDLHAQLEILLSVCNAVAYAHSRGVVHNDLKPHNVMLGEYGEILLMDWGLAVCVDGPGGAGLRPRSRLSGPFGTPRYMAPEQARGEPDAIAPTTDIYLLGGVLLELVTGSPPHRGKRLIDILLSLDKPPAIDVPEGVPPALEGICRRALAPDPGDRFPDVQSFVDALRGVLAHWQSEEVASVARSALRACETEPRRDQLYARYAEAVAGFRQALRLWPENTQVQEDLAQAHLRFARSALDNADLGLAEAQLQQAGSELPDSTVLARELARRDAEQRRQRRRTRLTRQALLVALVLLAVGSLSAALVYRAQGRTIARQLDELDARADTIRMEFELAESRGELLVRTLFDMYDAIRELERSTATAASRRAVRAIQQSNVERWRQLGEIDRGSDRFWLGYAGALLNESALQLEADDDPVAALATLAEAERIYRKFERNAPELRPLLASTMVRRADALLHLDRLDAARSALDSCSTWMAGAPGSLLFQANRDDVRARLAIASDSVEIAIAAYTRNVERLHGVDTRDEPELRGTRVKALSSLAVLHRMQGSDGYASLLARLAVDQAREECAQFPGNPHLRSLLAASLYALGEVTAESGDVATAKELFGDSFATQRQVFARDPASGQDGLAAVAFGTRYAQLCQRAEAFEEGLKALALVDAVAAEVGGRGYSELLDLALDRRLCGGQILIRLGRMDEAVRELRAAVDVFAQGAALSAGRLRLVVLLVELLETMGETGEAARAAALLAEHHRALQPGSLTHVRSLLTAARLQRAAGQTQPETLREAIALLEGLLESRPGDPQLGQALATALSHAIHAGVVDPLEASARGLELLAPLPQSAELLVVSTALHAAARDHHFQAGNLPEASAASRALLDSYETLCGLDRADHRLHAWGIAMWTDAMLELSEESFARGHAQARAALGLLREAGAQGALSLARREREWSQLLGQLFLLGHLAPTDAGEHMLFARVLVAEGREEAVAAFAAALALEPRTDWLLEAARGACSLAAALPAQREGLEVQALTWLAAHLQAVATEARAADGPRRQQLRVAAAALRVDPAFAALQGREDFARLFDELSD